jgi:hypothetical protein
VATQATATQVAAWKIAAERAHIVATIRSSNPASLKQLRRVCQLLTSHTIKPEERVIYMEDLREGCSKTRAGEIMDELIPLVRQRKATEATLLLGRFAEQ